MALKFQNVFKQFLKTLKDLIFCIYMYHSRVRFHTYKAEAYKIVYLKRFNLIYVSLNDIYYHAVKIYISDFLVYF